MQITREPGVAGGADATWEEPWGRQPPPGWPVLASAPSTLTQRGRHPLQSHERWAVLWKAWPPSEHMAGGAGQAPVGKAEGRPRPPKGMHLTLKPLKGPTEKD